MQVRRPGPFGARSATIEIDRGQAVFRVGVTSQMRFRKERHSGNASRRWKAVPDDFADNLQVQLADCSLKNGLQQLEATQGFGVATVSIYEPFSADDHWS